MVKVKIIQTRYGNGRIAYAAGSVVSLSEAKAAQAEANKWGKIIEAEEPVKRTATNKAAVNREIAADVTVEPTPRRRRKKKTDK